MNAATTINLTEKAKNVLAIIAAGASTRDEIAESMGVSVPVVNGSLTMLKRNGLVEIADDGAVSVTPDAADYVEMPEGKDTPAQRSSRPGSKMEQAREVFAKFVEQGRQAVLEQFRNTIGLTPAGAATYYQTLRHEAEAAGAAFQKSRPKPTAAPPPAAKQATPVKRRVAK